MVRTKTSDVVDALRENILAGLMAPSGKMPSLRALAVNFGVSSQVTYSALSILEKDGWVESNGRRGYSVVGGQASVKTPRNITVGIVASCPSGIVGSFHARTASSIMKIEELVNAGGSRATLFNTFPEARITDRIIAEIEQEKPAGLLYIPSSSAGNRDMDLDCYRLKGLGLPLIVHQRSIPDFDCVDYDNKQMGGDAASHLLSLGHRNISFLAYREDDYPWMADRVEGFQKFFSAHGSMASGKVLRMGSLAGHPDMEEVREFLEQTEFGFTGLVCANDWLALKVMEILRDMGLTVPEDISVIGFDNESEAIIDRLTTFHPSGEAMGKTAHDLLMRRIAGQGSTSPVHLKVKCPLIRRNTSSWRRDAQNKAET